MEYIEYNGINTNNLKNIDVKIKKNKITCITGPSGSGKSSLAFNTIYQISQNELNQLYGYENFKNEFIVHNYNNIIPSVALEQNNFNNNPRSTIATYYGIDKSFNKIFSFYNNVSFNQFSFNKLESACKKCRGLGYEFSPDITKMIDYDTKVRDIPFDNWKNSELDYYKQIMEKYCHEMNIDLDEKFRYLNKDAKETLLFGTSCNKYKINYKQGGRKRVKTDYYKGPISQLQEKIDKNNLSSRDKNFLVKAICSKCNGYRFSKKVLKYKLFDKNLGEIYTVDLKSLKKWFLSHKKDWVNNQDCNNIIERIMNFIDKLISLKLGYLNFNRSISSLSGGELQRLRLAKVLNTQFNNILYVLDEPSSGLHPSEYDPIIQNMLTVAAKDNTIVFIDHNPYFLTIGDEIIVLGPEAGKKGGYILDSTSYLNHIRSELDYKFFDTTSYVKIENESYNNIKNLSVEIPMNSLIGICGVSGSGKTSFVKGVLPKYIENLIYTSQKPINGNAYSIVATYIDVLVNIRSLFAKENNVDENMFSFYANSKGACTTCNGKGYITYQSSLDDTFSYKCPDCDGKRFNEEAMQYSFNNYSILDILDKTVDELVEIFKGANSNIISTLYIMQKLGLGYINIFQSVQSLSGGESQRLKLTKILKKVSKSKVIVLDEPFKGLSSNNISDIMKFLYEIVENNTTIIIIEHNSFALSHCSYLLEFGPESGMNGGKIIYNGTKEGIRTCKKSRTKEFLIY